MFLGNWYIWEQQIKVSLYIAFASARITITALCEVLPSSICCPNLLFACFKKATTGSYLLIQHLYVQVNKGFE
jgi:hypothetical protein